MSSRLLHHFLEESAQKYPHNIAAVEPGSKQITYADLNALADRVSKELRENGVLPGDRVGLHLPKSIASLASLFGILKCRATYVPVDFAAPSGRNGYIFNDCAVRCVLSHAPDGTGLAAANSSRKLVPDQDEYLADVVLVPGNGNADEAISGIPPDLAYILYTSGSTGQPKGVMLTHNNALAFIDWCSEVFEPVDYDRFSSHAPFHFDLSILDIFLPIKHGARVILIGEQEGRQPRMLASIIGEERITVWYSTPSILRLLLETKDIAEHDHSALRIVLFAGEVFPIKHLQSLVALWPKPVYYNLYGPTETNVCTFHCVPTSKIEEKTKAVAIGKVCSGDVAAVMDEKHCSVPDGEAGELYVSGPSVTPGYWNLPERNSAAFYEDASGRRWYRTGDIVRKNRENDYIYISRRDRMIKRRGYRVELGEIEAALYKHESITEAAAVAIHNDNGDIIVKAFISWIGSDKPSIIKLKKYCVDNLPAYMIPDRFSIVPGFPKTSTDKIDYQKLKEMD